MTRARLGLARAAALALLAAPLAAHDHWIAPSTFSPALGQRVELRLRVGHPARFEEQIRDPRRVVLFEALAPGAEGPQPLLGVDGKVPAALYAPKVPGAHLLCYQSNHAFVELDAEAYRAFLREEGLDDVLAERERRGEGALPGRDSYLRCDKALVVAGGGPSAGFERVLGLPLELVLESDPAAFREGGEVRLRLLLAGAPLESRQIKLARLAEPHLVLLARTDAEGRARFLPQSGGAWAAFALHQRRAASEQGLAGDWEGLWASYAFELAGEPRAARH